VDDIITIDVEEIDEKILTNEVSDDALEASASDMLYTFTASVQILNCQLC
jgi:hypothetical protein